MPSATPENVDWSARNAGLRILMNGRGPLNGEEWRALIEACRELLKPSLDVFSLRPLGAVHVPPHKWWSGYKLTRDNPTVVSSGGLSLETQGIFISASPSYIGLTHIGGLSRDGKWVLATIEYEDEVLGGCIHNPIATKVRIEESDLATLFATIAEPQKIWEALSRTVEEWVGRSKALYQRASYLADTLVVEDEVLRIRGTQRNE